MQVLSESVRHRTCKTPARVDAAESASGARQPLAQSAIFDNRSFRLNDEATLNTVDLRNRTAWIHIVAVPAMSSVRLLPWLIRAYVALAGVGVLYLLFRWPGQ